MMISQSRFLAEPNTPVPKSGIKSSSGASSITRENVVASLAALISQPKCPCIAALKSFYNKDFEIGIYGEFGSGECWSLLRRDQLQFIKLQKIPITLPDIFCGLSTAEFFKRRI